jgi:hypothetical protein
LPHNKTYSKFPGIKTNIFGGLLFFLPQKECRTYRMLIISALCLILEVRICCVSLHCPSKKLRVPETFYSPIIWWLVIFFCLNVARRLRKAARMWI